MQQAVGLPVHIGSLEGRWSGLSPILLAHDVQVGEGANALRLDQVSVAPDMLGSLLARDLRIGRLELSGLSLSLKEGTDGQWQLEGLPVQQDQPMDPQQLLGRLQQVAELSLLDSQVTLQPLDHQPVALTYVGLNLRSGTSRQRLDLRLTLPDGQPPGNEPADQDAGRGLARCPGRLVPEPAAKRLVALGAGPADPGVETLRAQSGWRAVAEVGQGGGCKTPRCA